MILANGIERGEKNDVLTGTILSLNSMQSLKRKAKRRKKKEKERKLQPERSDRKRTPTPG